MESVRITFVNEEPVTWDVHPEVAAVLALYTDINAPINVSVNVKKVHLRILETIIHRKPAYFASFKTAYCCVQIALAIGLPSDMLDSTVRIKDGAGRPGYGLLLGDVYNMNEFVLDGNFKNVLEDVVRMKISDGVKLGLLDLLQTYDFAATLEEHTPKTADLLADVESERAKCWKRFMLPAHDYTITRSAHTFKVVKHEIPMLYPPVEYGAPVIVDHDTFARRFREFTCGVITLERDFAPDSEFPWQNAVVAGGSIAKLMDVQFDPRNHRQTDVDIFIFAVTPTENAAAVNKALKFFERPGVYFATNKSVVTIYIKNIRRKFQVISIGKTNPFEVIARFDFTVPQWCVWQGRVYATAGAILSASTRVAHVRNAHRFRHKRAIKLIHTGYDIEESDLIAAGSYTDAEFIRRVLDADRCWFYPRDEPDMEDEEYDQYVRAMISRESEAGLISADPAKAIRGVIICGSFSGGYGKDMSYENFQISDVVVNHRGIYSTLIGKYGKIALVSPVLTLDKIITDDLQIILTFTDLPVPFVEFCRILEVAVFPLVHRGQVDSHIITDCTISVELSRARVEKMNDSGRSMIRSTRGNDLNMIEAVGAGDKIQFLFNVALFTHPNNISFSAFKFIKYEEFDEAVLEDLPVTPYVEIENEIAFD